MKPYLSLYAIYSPIITAGKSGVLSLTHAYLNDSARLVIQSGEILNIWTQDKTGFEALKEVFGWVSFRSRFSLATSVRPIQSTSLDMCKFLTLAQKIESTVLKLLPRIPNCDVRVQINFNVNVDGKAGELGNDCRSLALELTNPASIRELVYKTGFSELHVFYRVHQLLNVGIAILVL